MKSSDSTVQALGTAFVLALSQGLPPVLGKPVSSAIAYLIGNRTFSPTFRAICVNQWVAHGGKCTPRQLRRAIRRVYQHQGRALYDFYNNLDRPQELEKKSLFTPRFQALMEECMAGKKKQGTLLVIPHLSGFNLSGLAVAQQGFKFLTLALPDPNRGYTWQNQLRNDRGMEVVPMTIETIQLARQRLKQGGTVLTGVDRPMEGSKYNPLFFGRPAPLPVAYIKLALKTGARVFGLGFHTLKDYTYVVDASDQIELESYQDPHEEMILNAQKVLAVLEKFIRQDPTQWMMFLPVWPDAAKEVPAI